MGKTNLEIGIDLWEGLSKVTFSGMSYAPPDFHFLKMGTEISYYPMPKEWRCGYCGSINDMIDKKCNSCSAPRGFIIEAVI